MSPTKEALAAQELSARTIDAIRYNAGYGTTVVNVLALCDEVTSLRAQIASMREDCAIVHRLDDDNTVGLAAALTACQAERDEAQDGIASIIVKWSKDKDTIADLQLALSEAREVQRVARTSTLVKALDDARRDTFEATRVAAAGVVEAYYVNEMKYVGVAIAGEVRALTLADISAPATTTCTEWDATHGLRCVTDGCTHNAAMGVMYCPHHLDLATTTGETK